MTTALASERQALVQACLDNPGDDLRRHVLADWLEEQGDLERAGALRTHRPRFWETNTYGGGDWNWWRQGPPANGTGPEDLPASIFDRLRQGIGAGNYREYKSPALAYADLVQAVMQEDSAAAP